VTAPVPSKCAGPMGAGIVANPCVVPGSTPRCLICPESPTYWRLAEVKPEGKRDEAAATS
jgi:hypothetical protein